MIIVPGKKTFDEADCPLHQMFFLPGTIMSGTHFFPFLFWFITYKKSKYVCFKAEEFTTCIYSIQTIILK